MPCPACFRIYSAQARVIPTGIFTLHTSVYTARLIETAYPAPNPGRDKDKALYCRPIACGRRLSVYVCPPCNRSPATGRCVAGNLSYYHSRTAQPWPFHSSVGCRQEGSRRLAVGIGFFWKASHACFYYIEVFVFVNCAAVFCPCGQSTLAAHVSRITCPWPTSDQESQA